MPKNNCYIFWDETNVYVQCEKCHSDNNKGVLWQVFYGKTAVKCDLCHTIIYQKKKKNKNKEGNEQN